jgi:hypothetical protein
LKSLALGGSGWPILGELFTERRGYLPRFAGPLLPWLSPLFLDVPEPCLLHVPSSLFVVWLPRLIVFSLRLGEPLHLFNLAVCTLVAISILVLGLRFEDLRVFGLKLHLFVVVSGKFRRC